jgi:NADH:ubiquinone oxidoreductase subunit 2 (subunit N)
VENLTQWAATAQELITRLGLNLVAALLILWIGQRLAKLVGRTTRRLMVKQNVDPTLVNFTASLVYYIFLAFVVIAALNRLGIQTASLIAVLGAAGLAVGLALQGSLSNFAAGVLMLATGRDTLAGLAGVAGRVPVTLFAFGLAGVTLMGLPPSGGFLAKWLLIEAALSHGQWPWVVVVIGGGLLAAAYVFKVLRQAFLLAPEDSRFHPVPRSMEWAAFVLAAASVVLGLRGVELMTLLARSAA